MKIAVIGGASRLGSKVITILKQNAPRGIAAGQEMNVDTVSVDCLPMGDGVTRDASNSTQPSLGCRGKDCARCSSCSAIGRPTIADPEVLCTDETVILDADRDPREVIADPEVFYFGVRLADLRLLPDDRIIPEATALGGWLATLPSPHQK